MGKTKLSKNLNTDTSQWKLLENRFFRLAMIQLWREGHPLFYWEEFGGKRVIAVDVDHKDYDDKKILFTILHKGLELIKEWERNLARNEVKK